MTGRRVAWLLIAGIALVVFAIWLSSRRHLERSIMAGDLVLPGLEQNVNGVVTIRLHKAGDVHTTLQKDGSDWNVTERGWPADRSKVRKLLLDLGALNIVEEKPVQGPAFTAAREKKDDANFSVAPLPKGRVLTGPGAAAAVTAALSSLELDDVHKANVPGDAQVSHAVFRTFDGLEVDVSGRKDGARSLVAFTASSSAKESEAEAHKLNAHLNGWEFEIPDYKYTAIFTPLEDLLQKPPEPAKKKSASAAQPAKPQPLPVQITK